MIDRPTDACPDCLRPSPMTDRCPTCESGTPVFTRIGYPGKCPDPWHDWPTCPSCGGTDRGVRDIPGSLPGDGVCPDVWHDDDNLATQLDEMMAELVEGYGLGDTPLGFTGSRNLIDAAGARIRALGQWKAEATTVMDDWLNVWKALGRPGVLGESLAHASEQEVAGLVARIRELEAENARLKRAAESERHWNRMHR